MDPVAALTRLGGVARRREICELTTRRQLENAVAAGTVVRLTRSTFALPAADAARAAAARVGGTVSHLSGAMRWGWKVKFPPERPTVTVPRRSCRLDSDGIELHWADLGPEDVVDGVTTQVRTVVDCLRTYDDGVGLSVADSALRGGLSQSVLIQAAEASPRTGRARAVRLAKAANRAVANPFESTLHSITLTVPGLHVLPQVWIGSIGRADFVDLRLKLAIEAESHEFHADRESLARDVRRYTWFARLGYAVVRFTWEEVMFDPDYVRAVLVDMVARLSRAA